MVLLQLLYLLAAALASAAAGWSSGVLGTDAFQQLHDVVVCRQQHMQQY
jgi:hypothetical protein